MTHQTADRMLSDEELAKLWEWHQRDEDAFLTGSQVTELFCHIRATKALMIAAREMLAHTDIGSLPNDFTLQQVAEARIDDLIKLRWQVRDTCARAEKAEANLNAAQAIVNEQADDGTLWVPQSAAEAVLIAALRRLHEVVEGKTSAECARALLAARPAPPADEAVVAFSGAYLDEIDAAKVGQEWLDGLAIADNPTPSERGEIQNETSTVISLWKGGKPIAAYTSIRSSFNTTYLVRAAIAAVQKGGE